VNTVTTASWLGKSIGLLMLLNQPFVGRPIKKRTMMAVVVN
jgi:hypothetical protein